MTGDMPMQCLAQGGDGGGGGEDRSPDALEAALALVSASPGLKSGNVKVAGRRTSMRLAPSMWAALKEIAATEGISLDGLITAIDAQRDPKVGLANSVRTFAQEYFRRRWMHAQPMEGGGHAGQQAGEDGDGRVQDDAPEEG